MSIPGIGAGRASATSECWRVPEIDGTASEPAAAKTAEPEVTATRLDQDIGHIPDPKDRAGKNPARRVHFQAPTYTSDPLVQELPVGSTPVFEAIRTRDILQVAALVQAGGFNAASEPDPNGWTPLCAAAHRGCVKSAEILLTEGKVDVHQHNRSLGCSALHIAAQRGDCKMVELLMKHGANPFQADAQGNTPYQVAARLKQIEVSTLLARAQSQILKAEQKPLETQELNGHATWADLEDGMRRAAAFAAARK